MKFMLSPHGDCFQMVQRAEMLPVHFQSLVTCLMIHLGVGCVWFEAGDVLSLG